MVNFNLFTLIACAINYYDKFQDLFKQKGIINNLIIFLSGFFLLLFGNNYHKLSYIIIGGYVFVEFGIWFNYFIYNNLNDDEAVLLFGITTAVSIFVVSFSIWAKKITRMFPSFIMAYIISSLITFFTMSIITFGSVNVLLLIK